MSLIIPQKKKITVPKLIIPQKKKITVPKLIAPQKKKITVPKLIAPSSTKPTPTKPTPTKPTPTKRSKLSISSESSPAKRLIPSSKKLILSEPSQKSSSKKLILSSSSEQLSKNKTLQLPTTYAPSTITSDEAPHPNFHEWIDVFNSAYKVHVIREKFNEIDAKWRFPGLEISQAKVEYLEHLLNAIEGTGIYQASGDVFVNNLANTQMKLLESIYNEKFEQLMNKGMEEVTEMDFNFDQIDRAPHQSDKGDIAIFKQQVENRKNITLKKLDEILTLVSTTNMRKIPSDILDEIKEKSGILKLEAQRDLLISLRNAVISGRPDADQNVARLFNQDNMTRALQYVGVVPAANKIRGAGSSQLDAAKLRTLGLDALKGLLIIAAVLEKASPKEAVKAKALGDGFEYALKDFANMINIGVYDTATNLCYKTFGSARVTGGEQTGTNVNTKIQIDEKILEQFGTIEEVRNKKHKVTNKKVLIELDDIAVTNNNDKSTTDTKTRKNEYGPITVFKKMILAPDSSRQGKMDVSWKMVDSANKVTDFRISAKNWQQLSGHDLGKTSLLYAIIRSSAPNNLSRFWTQWYEMGLQDQGLDNGLTAFHDFAKLCAAIDIALGYSQGHSADTGYANVLVVFDRDAHHFYVRSMKRLLETLFMKTDAVLKVQGYYDYDLELLALKIRDKIHDLENNDSKTPSTQLYFSLMHQFLNQIEVSIAVKAENFLKMK